MIIFCPFCILICLIFKTEFSAALFSLHPRPQNLPRLHDPTVSHQGDPIPPFYSFPKIFLLLHENISPPCEKNPIKYFSPLCENSLDLLLPLVRKYPKQAYPGLWELPLVMWNDHRDGRCSMADACSNPPDAEVSS